VDLYTEGHKLAIKPTHAKKETKMSTVSTTNRVANQKLFIALAFLLVAVLTFAVAPVITSTKSAIIPLAGNQNVYVDFLRGEKVIYANPTGVNTALADYRVGEQTLYTYAVNSNGALEAYRAGEKAVVPNAESTLVEYRQGEKNIK